MVAEGLLSFISADCCQLVKMLTILEPHGLFYYLYNFSIDRECYKEKENIKKKSIGHAVGLQKSLLDYSATTYDIHTRAIYLYTLYLYSSD